MMGQDCIITRNLASIGGIAIWGLGNFYYWGNVAGLCLCGLAAKTLNRVAYRLCWKYLRRLVSRPAFFITSRKLDW